MEKELTTCIVNSNLHRYNIYLLTVQRKEGIKIVKMSDDIHFLCIIILFFIIITIIQVVRYNFLVLEPMGRTYSGIINRIIIDYGLNIFLHGVYNAPKAFSHNIIICVKDNNIIYLIEKELNS